MQQKAFFASIPELAPLLEGADHIDCKTVESNKTLREFLAGLIYYNPGWLRFLYVIRGGLVRLLGMRQEYQGYKAVPPEKISFKAGEPCHFFTVMAGDEERYIAAFAEDKHLKATLLVAIEPLNTGVNRFHVGTVVHHKHWTGPIYFTIIKPFHHIVVHFMMQAGAK